MRLYRYAVIAQDITIPSRCRHSLRYSCCYCPDVMLRVLAHSGSTQPRRANSSCFMLHYDDVPDGYARQRAGKREPKWISRSLLSPGRQIRRIQAGRSTRTAAFAIRLCTNAFTHRVR